MSLEEILAATENTLKNGGAPVILSEENDLGKIDWQAAQMDVLEMAKMGRTNVVTAAIRRADLDATTGKVAVMVAGPAAWHKLGVNVAEAVSSEHAIRLAGQDWEVVKSPAQYQFGDEMRTMKGQYILVRQDTGAALGVVGSRYQIIQNRDGYRFLDKVMGDFQAKYATAGAVRGGAKIWMQVALPQSNFEVVRGDEVQAYATFFNVHDGSGKAHVFSTTTRVVCNNTLRIGLTDKGKGIGIRHSGNIEASIADAQEALGLAVTGFKKFEEQAHVLVRTPVMNPRGFFGNVLDNVLDITQAKAQMGAARLADADYLAGMIKTAEARNKAEVSYAKAIERRTNILDDILERYESSRNTVSGIGGSAWAALNAVTEHVNHSDFGRKVGSETERAGRRLEDLLDGDRDELSQVALREALALAS